MIVATEFNFIPATCEGLTSSPDPIFRCNAFVETGGDADYIYGYTCEQSFRTDRERRQHWYDEHGYYLCCCGESFATWALGRAHIKAVAQSRLGKSLDAIEWVTLHAMMHKG